MKLSLRLLFLTFFAITLCSVTAFSQTATIATDLLDYPPGSTAIITGSGFQPGETVTLQVLHYPTGGDDSTSPDHQPWTVIADASGNISSSWYVPSDQDELGATLQLTAVGQSSGLQASEVFTDASSITIAITTGTNPTCSGSSVTFTVTKTGGSCTPVYQWLKNSNPISGQTSNTFTSTTLLNGDVITCTQSATSNGCSATTSNAITMIVSTTAPATPGTITQPTNTCANSTNNTFTIAAVSGATSYTWSVTGTGWSVTGGQGTTSGIITIGSGVGTVSVTASNACGTSAAASTGNITPTTAPATPGAITRPANECSGSTGNIYSISAVSGASSYTWSVTGTGWSVTGGQGTTSGIITIGSGVGSVSVTASNACGTSAAASTGNITPTTAPATPGAITRPANECSGSTGNIYSISAVSGASSYTWSVTGTGWSVTGGQGTTSATITIGSAVGTVSVTASNACGTSAARSTGNITPSIIPATPGAITRPANECSGSTGNTYSISAVSGATSYTWSVTGTGWSVAGGQGTTSATITIGSGVGTVSVTASNGCGTSASASTTGNITPSTAPAITTNPTSQTICMGGSFTLTAAASGSPAPSVQWQISSNGTSWNDISGQTGTSLTTTQNQASRQYRAVFTNGCGSATTTAAIITANTAAAITTNPGNVTVTAPTGATFSVAASGSPLTFQWQENAGSGFSNLSNGGIYGGVNTATLTLSSTTVSMNGYRYQCIVSVASCGSVTSNAATLTVINPCTAPIVSVPSNQSATTDPGVCSAAVTYTASASGTSPTITYTFTGATTGSGSGTGSGSTFNGGVTTVSVTATNGCGTDTKSFTVTVNDNIKPNITGVPTNITINSNDANTSSCTQVATWTAPTATDNCSVSTFTSDHNSGDAFPVGTTTVTYTATDASNNVQTASFTVTVNDNTKPVIHNVPANITINSNDANTSSCTQVATWTAPTATDNCSVSTFTSDHNSGDAFPVGTTTVTYTATDASNNVQTASFTVTVNDNTKPVIHDVPANITINSNDANTSSCTQVATWVAPTATDNCSVSTFTSDHNSGDAFPVGTTTVTYTATDASNNVQTASFTVTVNDNTKPVIHNVPANITINSNDANTSSCTQVATWTAPTATDNCSVSTFTSDHNSGDAFPVGTTTVTYTATDASNNVQTASFTVTVNDNTKPVIHDVPANITINSNDANTSSCTQVATWVAPTATDNCSVSTFTSDHNSGDAFPVGTTTVTYTATDASNNVQTASFTVTVNDNTKPVIHNVPANITINSNDANTSSCTQVATWVAPTATDNCSVSTFTSDHNSGDAFPVGTTTVTYTATDASNNVQTASFTVTVVDNTKPIINSVPANITIYSNNANPLSCTQIATWTAPTASDNCSVSTFTSDHHSGDAFPVGTTTVTYTATDANSNVQTASFTVTVVDNTNPTISCPGNITLSACTPTATWSTPIFSDNCSGATIAQTAGPASGSTFANGSTTTITYTATDVAGNQKSCSFTVSRLAELKDSVYDDNPVLYYGYTLDQTAHITVKPTGGKAPYTVEISMHRPLGCNRITSSGDEVWTPGANTFSNTNYSCPVSGPGTVNPVSTSTNTIPDSTVNPIGYTVTVTLDSTSVIYVKITDANGCIKYDSTKIRALDVRCFAGNSGITKITMCHLTGSSKNPTVQICVDQNAVQAQLALGDYLGACGAVFTSSPQEITIAQTNATKLEAKVLPNPTSYYFTLGLKSASNERVKLTVVDVLGRVIEQRSDVPANSNLQIGNNYHPGIYFAQVIQGKETIVLKLIKEGK